MTAPIHPNPDPVIDLAIALEESKEREIVLRGELDYKESVIQALNDRNANHRQTLAGIRDMQKLEHAKQWAKDALSGYAQPVEATLLELTQENHALLAEIAEIKKRLPRWIAARESEPHSCDDPLINAYDLREFVKGKVLVDAQTLELAQMHLEDLAAEAWKDSLEKHEYARIAGVFKQALLPATPDQTNEHS